MDESAVGPNAASVQYIQFHTSLPPREGEASARLKKTQTSRRVNSPNIATPTMLAFLSPILDVSLAKDKTGNSNGC